jgi:hypothetical protein
MPPPRPGTSVLLLTAALLLAHPLLSGSDLGPPSCSELEERCGACRCLIHGSEQHCAEGTSAVPRNCTDSTICDTDAMAACPGLARVRQGICHARSHHPCPCRLTVPNGYFRRAVVQKEGSGAQGCPAGKICPAPAPCTCFGSASCGCTEADLGVAEIPWNVDVALLCADGFTSSDSGAYSCELPTAESLVNGTTVDKLTLWSTGATRTEFAGKCLEDNNNLGDTWVVRGGAFLSLVGGGVLVKLFGTRAEVRRSAVDLDHLLFLSLTLCTVALCAIWGSLSQVDCARQGPATLAATLSTLVLALHLHISVFRNMRTRAGGTRRPPRRLLVKLALFVFGWVVPAAVGAGVALVSPEGFVLDHQNSDEPFLCTWSRAQPDTRLKRWALMDGPALFVYSLSALLASQMLCSWCGCACAVGTPRAAAAKDHALQLSLLDSSDSGGGGGMGMGGDPKREGALAELDEGARRVADLAGRQLWMMLSFLLCWTPRIFLTLMDLCEDSGVCASGTASEGGGADGGSNSPPLAVEIARHLHALLWPLQGFFLLLAFRNVQNGGVLQEKGSYEELMARIGYARQEAFSVSQRGGVSPMGSPSTDRAGGGWAASEDAAAIRSSVSAGV